MHEKTLKQIYFAGNQQNKSWCFGFSTSFKTLRPPVAGVFTEEESYKDGESTQNLLRMYLIRL